MILHQTNTVVEKLKRGERLTVDDAKVLAQEIAGGPWKPRRRGGMRERAMFLAFQKAFEIGIQKRREAGYKNAIVLFHRREVKRTRWRAWERAYHKRIYSADLVSARSFKCTIDEINRESERASGSRKKERGRRRKYRNMSL